MKSLSEAWLPESSLRARVSVFQKKVRFVKCEVLAPGHRVTCG